MINNQRGRTQPNVGSVTPGQVVLGYEAGLARHGEQGRKLHSSLALLELLPQVPALTSLLA